MLFGFFSYPYDVRGRAMRESEFRSRARRYEWIQLAVGGPFFLIFMVVGAVLLSQETFSIAIWAAFGVTLIFDTWWLYFYLPRRMGLTCSSCNLKLAGMQLFSGVRDSAVREAMENGMCPRCASAIWSV